MEFTLLKGKEWADLPLSYRQVQAYYTTYLRKLHCGMVKIC